MKKTPKLVSAVLFMAITALPGCSTPDRMVQANYSQIQQNVHTQTDVEALIGPPSNKLGDMWLYERPDQHVTVMIDFGPDGRVTRKQWVGGLEGAWHDTKEAPKR